MQQREDHGDVLNVVLPVADELIWSTTFASAADSTTARTVADLGYSATTTLGEIMQADSAARHIRV